MIGSANKDMVMSFELVIRQQPLQSRMCGVGDKVDRRPIDPPLIVELQTFHHSSPSLSPSSSTSSLSPFLSSSSHFQRKGKQYWQEECMTNLFLTAILIPTNRTKPSLSSSSSLPTTSASSSTSPSVDHLRTYATTAHVSNDQYDHTKPNTDTKSTLTPPPLDIHLHSQLTVGRTVSSLYHFKDLDDIPKRFFVFSDLSIRVEGVYRFQLCLFQIVGSSVLFQQSILTDEFTVYSAKKFPGMFGSCPLARCFAEQGLKIRIRNSSGPRQYRHHHHHRRQHHQQHQRQRQRQREHLSPAIMQTESDTTDQRHRQSPLSSTSSPSSSASSCSSSSCSSSPEPSKTSKTLSVDSNTASRRQVVDDGDDDTRMTDTEDDRRDDKKKKQKQKQDNTSTTIMSASTSICPERRYSLPTVFRNMSSLSPSTSPRYPHTSTTIPATTTSDVSSQLPLISSSLETTAAAAAASTATTYATSFPAFPSYTVHSSTLGITTPTSSAAAAASLTPTLASTSSSTFMSSSSPAFYYQQQQQQQQQSLPTDGRQFSSSSSPSSYQQYPPFAISSSPSSSSSSSTSMPPQLPSFRDFIQNIQKHHEQQQQGHHHRHHQ